MLKVRISASDAQAMLASVEGNRLQTFVDYVGKSGNNLIALFVCECGNHHIAQLWNVLNGASSSCGCKARGPQVVVSKSSLKRRARRIELGPSHELRATYAGMIARCYEPRHKSFRYYGMKGVAVCERWRNSFLDFVGDMGPRPSPAHSVDRINPYGNYEPGNCRWATRKEQANNTRAKWTQKRITA